MIRFTKSLTIWFEAHIERMKVVTFFTIWTVATAFPKGKVLLTKDSSKNGKYVEANFSIESFYPTEHQMVANISCESSPLFISEEVLSRLLTFVNGVVDNGRAELRISPLDTIELENYNLVIPAGLIYLDLKLKNISAIGLSNYIVHKSKLDVNNRTFDVDLEFLNLRIVSEEYDLLGHVYTVMPLYGKGRSEFNVGEFRFGAKLQLAQAEHGKSFLIEDIENAWFSIRYIKSNLTGVVGGGDIDAVVNALIEEVLLYYVNRFNGAIALLIAQSSALVGNPVLDQLDTWQKIETLGHYNYLTEMFML